MGWVGNAWEGAHEWVEVEEQVRELAAGVGPERIMRVTFESLVSEPEKTLGTICGFLGLEYDDAMLDYEGDSTYKRPSAGTVAKWKKHDRTMDIRLIESIQCEALLEAGYELSTHRPMNPGPVRRAMLRVDSRVRKALFRMNRYGVKLWLKSLVLARLGTAEGRRQIQLEINEVDRRHLK